MQTQKPRLKTTETRRSTQVDEAGAVRTSLSAQEIVDREAATTISEVVRGVLITNQEMVVQTSQTKFMLKEFKVAQRVTSKSSFRNADQSVESF